MMFNLLSRAIVYLITMYVSGSSNMNDSSDNEFIKFDIAEQTTKHLSVLRRRCYRFNKCHIVNLDLSQPYLKVDQKPPTDVSISDSLGILHCHSQTYTYNMVQGVGFKLTRILVQWKQFDHHQDRVDTFLFNMFGGY